MKFRWFLSKGMLRKKKSKDLKEAFPLSAVTLHPLSQIAELFIYANTKLCSLKESILWPKPLPHSQLDPDVVLQHLSQLPVISEIKSETPRGQVVFALNADTHFSAVSLLLLHFSCLFKLMCS